jgi:hypothetical protein
MSMDSVSLDNVQKLQKEYKEKGKELDEIKNTKVEDMWLKELLDLEKVYLDYITERQQLSKDDHVNKKKNVIKNETKITKKKAL